MGLLLLAIVAASRMASVTEAAELRLHHRCEVAGPVVTLGDVADVLSADAQDVQRLAAIELFPAPQAGRTRLVRQREIEDLLVLRGTNLLGHRFSGASQVSVTRADTTTPRIVEQRVVASVARRAERLAREAILSYLNEQVAEPEPWSVEIELDSRHAEAVSAAGERIMVRGGRSPWTGRQQFEVFFDTAGGPVAFGVAVNVSLPDAVAVTLRPIPRGTLIQPADVQLERGLPVAGDGEGFQSIEELVGKETTRTIAAGKVIEKGFVRAPLLVHRGQVVTVHANRSGIRVRTTARARDDGSLGDLVAVESLLDRKAFFARVCDTQEVEVYARALPAGGRAQAEIATRSQGELR